MCVFDFWAWRSTFPEPTEDTVPVNVIWQKSKAGSSPCCISFDQTPREHSFLLSQGRWTEQKVGAWEDFRWVMGLLVMEHGSGDGEVVVVGGVCVGGTKPWVQDNSACFS